MVMNFLNTLRDYRNMALGTKITAYLIFVFKKWFWSQTYIVICICYGGI